MQMCSDGTWTTLGTGKVTLQTGDRLVAVLFGKAAGEYL